MFDKLKFLFVVTLLFCLLSSSFCQIQSLVNMLMNGGNSEAVFGFSVFRVLLNASERINRPSLSISPPSGIVNLEHFSPSQSKP